VPWGIIISRSVQPDSLMMMMFLISLYLIVHYFDHPGWRRLILAGIITGLTLLLRPLVIFALFCTFIALSIHHKGFKHFFDRKFAVFFCLSLAFPIAFYGYGIFIAGFLQGQAALSFRPHLLFQLKFWQNWVELGVGVAGPAALIAAFIGFLSFKKSFSRTLIIGLLIGYFFFGIIFTFHIITHPYYHIQLFPDHRHLCFEFFWFKSLHH
jgi:4-amino-4-deoxy-L-arabinose transferase-like glycosyltransferase